VYSINDLTENTELKRYKTFCSGSWPRIYCRRS